VELTGDRLFRRALEAAAKVLRDLEGDQIPADLRRVAGLPLPLPPPLARSLLKGLDRYDWLRERALEAWPDADVKQAGPDRASALLLQRPAGWVADLAALAAASGGEGARGAGDELARRLASAEEELAEWKKRARAEKDAGQKARREAEAALAEERAARKSRQATVARADAALEAEMERVRSARRETEAERDAAREEARRCREAVAEERRRRAEAEAALEQGGKRAHWADDPVSLASFLDWAAGMARLPGPGAPEEAGPPAGRLRLPEGLRPDERAAVDWLVQRTEGVTVIVDGYNAGFKLTSSRDPAVMRRRVLMALERWQQVARGPMRVLGVFDSRLGTVGEAPAPGPVETRFTAEEGGADQEIADLAGTLSGARVVVSSDRAVREAAEAVGAVTLWSEALADWWKRR
jgi:hypothetical protein